MGIRNRPCRLFQRDNVIILTSLSLFPSLLVDAFLTPQHHLPSPLTSSSSPRLPSNQHYHHNPTSTILFVKQSRSTLSRPPSTPPPPNPEDNDDDDEVYGTKFFGGSAIKDELFDEELEENAARVQRLYPRQKKKKKRRWPEDNEEEEEEASTYERFDDKDAFPDDAGRELGMRLQTGINRALYEDNDGEEGELEGLDVDLLYDRGMTPNDWITPFCDGGKAAMDPMEGLTLALEYYKRVDVAVISARTVSSDPSTGQTTLKVRWEISVQWPNAFESRVLLSGTSAVVTSSDINRLPTIISQTDTLDATAPTADLRVQNIVTSVATQLTPRFWDLYHVAMTPSAEMMPRLHTQTGGDLLAGIGVGISYKLFEIPPRLVLNPTMVDVQGREGRDAEAAPNHAFTSIIRTTGRTGQRFVTTSPLEVSIRRKPWSEVYQDKPKQKEFVPVIEWSIPLPPEFLSYDNSLPLPSLDSTDLADEFESEQIYETYAPTCNYVYRARRRVATVPYGGSPQDADVSEVRKKLYERVVVKDGMRPRLDGEGRPMFFFLQNDAKLCFTADGGFGMAVYDWRPEGVMANEVGIELELE